MNMRNAEVGNYMIDMETYDQLIQFLGTIISTLHTQKFLLEVLMSVGPLILLLGIILRSFFLTRKLGGLLMAFGIGFMVVYPATYALAYFTLNAAVYGVDTKAGGALPVCPAACSTTSPAFVEITYDRDCYRERCTQIGERGAAYTGDVAAELRASEVVDGIKEGRYDILNESERETFLRNASPYTKAIYLGEDGLYHELVTCKNLWGTIDVPGASAQKCDWQCMEIPYPHHLRGCTDEEAVCQAAYEEYPECFATRAMEESDPVLVEVDDTELNGCPADCRAMYPSQISEPRKAVMSGGYWVRWDDLADCPPQCRWVSTSPVCTEGGIAGVIGGMVSTAAYMDPACPDVCRSFAPDAETASSIWCAGSESGEPNPTAFYIIPEIVFTNPEHCEPCIYVLDKGLTYQPEQVFLNCQTMCGTAGGAAYSYEDPATMTNQVDGFVGTTEMKSVSKLAIPAFLLPIFGLAVTLMFIQALSPMLGGDIDIPGMMRML
jgi:hypothetical protein